MEEGRESAGGLGGLVRGNAPGGSESIGGGDWSDETKGKLETAVSTYAEDFGYDLDEEGLPLDDEARAA